MGKKLLIGIGGLFGLLIVGLLAAPFFFDINSYKPTIAAEVKKATGRDLVIDGKISLSLLPTPTVSIAGVKFFNVAGSKNANMVELKSVTVKPALFAMLAGNIEVSEVTLVEPKIVLEINAQGKPNWEFAGSAAEAKPAAAQPSSPKPLSLGRLTIENGTLIFSDSKAGLSVTAEKANFSASVGSLDGPYSLAGGATINGAPLKLDLSVGAKGASGHAMQVALEANGGKIGFKGNLSELGPNARVSGAASVAAESLSTFITSLVNLAGLPAPALPPLLAAKFTFDGGIDASQTAVAAKDFKLALGESSGSGSLAVTLKPALAVEGKVSIPKLDLDKTLAALSAPAAPKPATPAGPAPAPSPANAPAAAGGGIPADLTAKFSLDMAEVIYNKAAVRNVAVELDVRGGAIAVPKLTATLPGDLVLQAKSTMSGTAAKPTVSGEFSLAGSKLRETLGWLAVDVSSVPANKLARLSFKGKLASTGGNVQVSDALFELDDIKGNGNVAVTFGAPLSVVTQLQIDTIDVDSFMGPPAAGQKTAPAPATTASAAPPAAPAAGPTVGLKLKVNKVIYNKETIAGVDVDIALQGSTLRLNDVKVSNLAGAQLAVRGSVGNYATAAPQPDIAFNFASTDMGRVMKLAGAAAPAGLTAASASGAVSGSIESMTLRDLTVVAMGYNVKANGTVSAPGAARGAPQSVGYKGSVTVNGQTIEGSVDARLAGKPNITADLRATTLDVEKLSGGGGGGGGAPARGAAPAAAANAPIDTGPLRSVDASVKFAAGTLISGTTRIANADIAATLKDGVLTLSHFKGALYGGQLAFSGVVNGSQPALSFDMKGDVNGILLGEMMRATSGSNQFGSAVKITIDGKLNANSIAIKGGGTTSEQIKSSMAGSAQLGGHVFVGADKTLTMIGGAATGAVGGVIDSTVGNALGAVGQKGGVGVGNILNAISLVLNRFVNHDNAISGRVDIVGGVLTDKGLAVQGSKAVANVSTRTNLAASTTDTTINFVISEEPSAPYLITTIRGPTSSLNYNVVRGSAKDPPGFASTLPGVGGGNSGGGGLIPSIPGLGGGGQQQPGNKAPGGGLPIPKIFGR